VTELAVQLGRLTLPNPILVASGTFGYAREMLSFVDVGRLGGVIPKTVTRSARIGNPPPRTVETPSGLLNSIGLDNDGLSVFLDKHWPVLSRLGAPIIVNIAGKTLDEFAEMAGELDGVPGIAALELNISCPNVSGGADFGTNPQQTAHVVRSVRAACRLPVIAKLTPNVTDVVPIAAAAAEAGADAVTLSNTFLGLAVDWRRRRPMLGNGFGGLSGPAIKPLALRIVRQVASQVAIPIVGVGGIQSLDDVMEFLVCGATAVQIGTANFYNPTLAVRLVDDLAATLAAMGCDRVGDVVGTLQWPGTSPTPVGACPAR
jgi:dihydroorotate dehydrogenase (NAD+) catalytic subunit